MSVETLKINIKDLNNRILETGKEIKNEPSYRSISKTRSPKSKIPSIFTRLLIRLRRSLSRLLQQKESNFNTQLEVFEDSLTYFIFFGRYLGIFPNIPSDQRKKYPLLSRGYTIPIITSLAQLVVVILILIRLLNTSINVITIFYLSYYGTSFVCSILVIRLATKWPDLKNLIKVADLNEYIDPSVKFKCNLATVAFITFVFIHNVLSVSSKLAVVLDSESHNKTFYEQLTAYGWIFEYGMPYAVPLGIMLMILNILATFNLTYYQIFVICVSLYLQSILEKINFKIISCNCECLSISYWRSLRQHYSKATQLVRSVDEIVNGLVFILFASNLYFICIQIYVLRLLHDYARGTTNTYNVYTTIHIIVNFLTVSLIATKVHSSSLKVAPLLYSVTPQSYCIEVQRFIEQIQGDPVALTGLNFFYVTKDVILTMLGTIVTYELVLLQLNTEPNENQIK